MEFKTKRRLSFFIIGAYLFLGGCEFAVIFPTVWDYLQSLGTDQEQWLGFTVSGYSFTASIAGLIGGRLSDKAQSKTKVIAIACILIMAIGNLQYTIGYSVWNVFSARCICGLGTAAGASMLAEVCRVTEPEERTPILAICNASRQLGILIAPAFQIILSRVNFKIWGFAITPLNAPGAFLVILCSVFAILTIFLFHNLADEFNEIKRQQREEAMNAMPQNVQIRGMSQGLQGAEESQDLSVSHNMHYSRPIPYARERLISIGVPNSLQSWQEASRIVEGERSMAFRTRKVSVSERFFDSVARSGTWAQRRGTLMTPPPPIPVPPATTATEQTPLLTSMQRYKDEFFRDTFIVLMSMTFVLFFCQIGIETVIPVIMQNSFGYGEFENSLVYMAGGVAALIVFFGVAYLSKRVRDTSLLAVGWTLMFLAQAFLMVIIPYFERGNRLHLLYYFIGVLVTFIGYPLASAANTGVYSKLLSSETQGLGQGLGRVTSFVGLIFGPMWASATVRTPYLYLGVPLILMALNTIMFVVSFKELRKVEEQHQRNEDEETQSLLG